MVNHSLDHASADENNSVKQVRPNPIEEVAVGCSSSNIKSKENFVLVRGLIAVGLSAYRGFYASLTEVSFEIQRVLELLVYRSMQRSRLGEIDINIFAFYCNWPIWETWLIAGHAPAQLNAYIAIDDHHANDQVQNEEPKPNGTSKCSDGLEVPEIGPQGGLEISDLSGQKSILMNSTLDKSLLDSDEILNDQNVTSRCPN
ncbi:unnamed protein product [Prunus armeniaca]|uniref:Uncharacterized protein n=2 Tax=Prunus armeniaca TaxID=36596 RepID=A0A6J5US92_PRUAR|nr:unnamed protein product [Prunus armeniaca]